MSASAFQFAATSALGIALFVWSPWNSSSMVTKSRTKKWLQQRFIQFFSSSPGAGATPRMDGVSTSTIIRSDQENRITRTSRDRNPDSPAQQLRALRIDVENRMMNQDRRINRLEKFAHGVQVDLAHGRRGIAMNRLALNAQGDMLKRGEEERMEMKKELEKVKGATEDHKMCFYIYSLSFVGILCYLSANGY